MYLDLYCGICAQHIKKDQNKQIQCKRGQTCVYAVRSVCVRGHHAMNDCECAMFVWMWLAVDMRRIWVFGCDRETGDEFNMFNVYCGGEGRVFRDRKCALELWSHKRYILFYSYNEINMPKMIYQINKSFLKKIFRIVPIWWKTSYNNGTHSRNGNKIHHPTVHC